MRFFAVLLAVIALAGGGAIYYTSRAESGPVEKLLLEPIKRGEVCSTISAGGTLEPEQLVDIGARVAGEIMEFGPDPHNPSKTIDYNTIVEKGCLLAKIDPTNYEAALEQAEATLAQSEASLMQLKAKVGQTEREWQRVQRLPKKAIADTDADTAMFNYEQAKANLAVGMATIRQNKASVQTAKVNLGYTVIRSPVRGTVIDRRVNVGQTVVASLNAPSLFLIGKDLTRMEVWAAVNEADIGRIHDGMTARFTVDAYGDQQFLGKVTQVRKNATMSNNVVTYTVIVTTDNTSGKLLPYLTANVRFEVERKIGVLLAPNAALRWTPQSSQIEPSVLQDAKATKPITAATVGRLWVAASAGKVQPIEATVGATDGVVTEVSGPEVKEGLAVVTGEAGQDSGDGQQEGGAGGEGADKTSNPFLPKPSKGSKPPPGPM